MKLQDGFITYVNQGLSAQGASAHIRTIRLPSIYEGALEDFS